jgi:cytoskeletal protein CcmA (bactofilin family)
MFLKTNKAEPAAPAAATSKKAVPSVISSELHILGNLLTDGVVDIDGSVEGNIKADQVTVRPNGKISGDIVAQAVHVYGNVRGMIRAHAVHLYSSCHVEGVIMHQSLSVEDGAFVDAKFKRLNEKSSSESTLSDTLDNEEFEESSPLISGNLRLIS